MQVAYRCQLGLDLGNALLAKVDWAPRLWAVDEDSRRHDAAVRQLSAPLGAGVGSARRRLRRVKSVAFDFEELFIKSINYLIQMIRVFKQILM